MFHTENSLAILYIALILSNLFIVFLRQLKNYTVLSIKLLLQNTLTFYIVV